MSGHLRKIAGFHYGRSQSSQLQCKYWSAANLRCARVLNCAATPSVEALMMICPVRVSNQEVRRTKVLLCDGCQKRTRTHNHGERSSSRLPSKTLINVEMNRWIVWTWAGETHLTSRKDPRRKQHVTVGLISSCNSFHWQRDRWSRFRNYRPDDSVS